ncbi:Regulatory domain of a methyltransferase-containing protein [Burkholderiales bacterium 8X]|nr:Regulatory domain of a methyltransferase-containing protein [Burkholderiales bacterium 8X]
MDQTTTTLSRYYDSVPYESHPFPQSTPEHLEALAFLFGLATPDPAGARVLELGCASGGNLIPFAARSPSATAVGIDLSSVQVDQGLAAIRAAGLKNIELRAMDVTDIDLSFGQFDYIICHGVFSWVPSDVQDAILRICEQNLVPGGIAYISYNTYPGWKAREIVRDAMVLRGAPRDEPGEKLSYARGMLDFLERSSRPDSVLRKTLEETMPIVRGASSAYLLHEFLEPCNSPCYFKSFVERAASHGLAYLADAEPATMFVQNYGESVREPLLRECGGSQVMMEQYLDFLVNRTFRQSLLVKQARAAEVRYRLSVDRLRALWYAGQFATLDGSPLSLDTAEQTCNTIRGHQVTLRLPVHKAVAQILEERFPAAVPVDLLIEDAARRVGQPAASIDAHVMAMLEELVILGAVRFRHTAPETAVEVPMFPMALRSVRVAPSIPLTAGPSAAACNQWHEAVELSLLERCLLPLLDGSRSHANLAAHLAAEAKAERLRFIKDDKPLTDETGLGEFTRKQVELALRDLWRKGLLTA